MLAPSGADMGKAIVLVLDSFGIGATDDAARYGDVGANTLASIAAHCRRVPDLD